MPDPRGWWDGWARWWRQRSRRKERDEATALRRVGAYSGAGTDGDRWTLPGSDGVLERGHGGVWVARMRGAGLVHLRLSRVGLTGAGDLFLGHPELDKRLRIETPDPVEAAVALGGLDPADLLHDFRLTVTPRTVELRMVGEADEVARLAARLRDGMQRHPWQELGVEGLELVDGVLKGEVGGFPVSVTSRLVDRRVHTRLRVSAPTGLRASRRPLLEAAPSGNVVVDQLVHTAGERGPLDDLAYVERLLAVVHGLGADIDEFGLLVQAPGWSIEDLPQQVEACVALAKELP